MRINRTQNAIRNIIYGTILKFYQVLMPFFMRWVMIQYLGAEFLGLTSLFTSILQVLNLAELGIGTAMVYAMYKPIANENQEELCALLNLYKKYYRIIGITVCGIGIIIMPFVPALISGSVPENINIYVLYMLNLAATVLSYWLFAYKNSLLQAYQRTDIASKVILVTDTLKYGFQIAAIVIFHNFYLYSIGIFLTQVLTNIITAYFVGRTYPHLRAKGNLSYEIVAKIKRSIKDIFTSKLGTVVVNSFDSIVISAFLGLQMLAVYQNYYSILIAVFAFFMIAMDACVGGIGNSLVTEALDKNYKDFCGLSFLVHWICGICICCFLNLYQPFMIIWMGEGMLLPFVCVVLFCSYYYMYSLTHYWCVYKNASGIWHEDRFRPLIGALVNLILNLLFVEKFGIIAIIMSTVLSYILVMMPWLLINLFKLLFKRSLSGYLKDTFKYLGVAFFCAAFSYCVCLIIPETGVMNLIFRAVISLIIPLVVYTLIYYRTENYQFVLKIVKRVFKH